MPTQPTGQQLEQLTTALLKAFKHDELTRLVQIHLDQSLEWITPVAGQRNLTTITSDLVAYCASQEGGLKKLLGAAVGQSPFNNALGKLAQEWGEIDFAPRPLPADHPSAGETTINNTTTIDTGGGAYVGGSVNTGGGSFVGGNQIIQGDQVQGDKVSGDKVGGDKVDSDKIVANIGNNNSGIAVGKSITQTNTHGIDDTQLDALFAQMAQAAASAPSKRAEAEEIVNDIKAEAAKGDQADDTHMAKLIDGFVALVPAGVGAVVSAFASPILGGAAGPVTKYAIGRLTEK